jgi:hypothetical protein
MGGTNELRILGYRAHVSGGTVHLHTDDGRKFERDLRGFLADVGDAMEALKGVDGAVAVTGSTDVSLVVGRLGKRTFTALTVDSDSADDLKRWAESC